MSRHRRTKLVHEGRYVAEVTVELIDSDDSWSPTMSLDDAYKLDDARTALKDGDLARASRYGRIYELQPITEKR